MNWFKNRKTATKLLIGFGVMAIVILAQAYVSSNEMEVLFGSLDQIHEKHATGLVHLNEASEQLNMISRTLDGAVLDGNAAAVPKQISDIQKYREIFSREFEAYQKSVVLDTTRAKAKEIEKLVIELIPEQDRILTLIHERDLEGARAELKTTRAANSQIDEKLSELVQSKFVLMNKAADEAAASFRSTRRLLLAMMIVTIGMAFGIGITTARLISRPLKETVDILQAVAEGDFTRRLEIATHDEVGQMAVALNQAVGGMRQALLDVSQASSSVAAASQQLAAASEELSSGAQEQASSLEETSATLEEITSTARQNADNARQANQLAGGSRDAAEKGGQVVTEAVAAMREINTASKQISDIITTIDEIAFQTNLLALNAAVEAARAGEQGRGFAVVAGEVRNLAGRSATAAKEIKALIQGSVRKVENGAQLVDRSGQTLQEIIVSVKRVTDIVGEIAAASQEQAIGVDQVNKAMSQMDNVTQANSAQTEELSSTAQSLSSHAEHLQRLVSRFKLGDGQSLKEEPVLQRPASPPMTEPVLKVVPKKARAAGAAGPVFAEAGAFKSLENGHHGVAKGQDGGFEEF